MSKSSVVAQLTEKKRANPPKWLPNSVIYETIMGSVAYGVSSDTSDMDIYGVCVPPKELVFPHLAGEIPGFGRQIPRFDVYQEHHLTDPDALGGNGREYDLNIFGIVKFFALAMENNPNILDSLFTPVSCVLHCNRIGQMIRENRRIFLHKGSWHKFKGYAYSQLHKMDIKNPQEGSKRAALIEQFGYDCYDDEETEFLTRRGWLKFDQIIEADDLGTVVPDTGEIVFQPFLRRIDKLYTGSLYTIEPYLNRCVVTEGHTMLVSSAHRNPANNYSTKYNHEKADWKLIPLECLLAGKRGSREYRSFFHIRRQGYSQATDYPVDDTYLQLAGLYIAEGSTRFRKNGVKAIALTQTEKGNAQFFSLANALMDAYPLRRYEYSKETVWLLGGDLARKLHHDFGHLSAGKHLPSWCFHLSKRQAELLWSAMMLGDGTRAVNGEVYYTSSKQLADDVQAMMTACGILITVRGPYRFTTTYGTPEMYQVFRSASSTAEYYLNFGRVLSNETPVHAEGQGWPIKRQEVIDRRVVCFTVPNGTLITRSNGKVAIQGNCKFGYHVVRLIDEVEQILSEGDMDLQRNREQLKAIRRGEWTAEQIKDHFTRKEKDLETLYANSPLPHGPDEAKIKQLLLDCLEAYYGSLAGAIVVPNQERDLLRQIKELCEKAGV